MTAGSGNSQPCSKCAARLGTEIWCEGVADYVYGVYQIWCRQCVLEAQISYAKALVATLPELERMLSELKP